MDDDDELELELVPVPVPGSIGEAIAMERAAEEERLEDEAYERLMAMGYDGDDHEASQWVILLRDLDDPDLGSSQIDNEDAIEAPGVGWVEDTHGGATFVPYC